ncbi:MAG: iron-containing alcohol dehydrogenase [Proteobacteria bacterium]|nr:MAG: iron-containing alcohol dehydrogenase [Pseudomonadota bacterium]
MWNYRNPVRVRFGVGSFERLAGVIDGRRYALVTYDEPVFRQLGDRLANQAGPAITIINNIRPNPDFIGLRTSCAQLAEFHDKVEVIVAVGGGSVIDAAKVMAFGPAGFDAVQRFLESLDGTVPAPALPLIAVPTTAGTGSEVTCWATVWDTETPKKYSLSRDDLYPTDALIDPALMVGMPRKLTINTGLDALSHSLESIWNRNANPVSTTFAITAARTVLECLPALSRDLENLELREKLARAAMMAGLAFSNTKTALAHSLSYPITLHHGVPHGVACSFSLPMVMRSVTGLDPCCDKALGEIFGDDLDAGADRLAALLESLDVPVDYTAHGVSRDEWAGWVVDAMDGERGRNFIGPKERVNKELLQT